MQSNRSYRQNTELARLRQDCVRLGRELTERSNALRADEDSRKSLKAKMAATEQELAQAKVRNSAVVLNILQKVVPRSSVNGT